MNKEFTNQDGVKESSAELTLANETGNSESIFPPELIQFARQIHVMYDWFDNYHLANLGLRYESDYDDHTDKIMDLLQETGDELSLIAGNEFKWAYCWNTPYEESKKARESKKQKSHE